MKIKCLLSMFAFAVVATAASVSWSQNVKITPIGSHTGQFCRNDRGLLFEDPTGVRILYDPGRAVAGGGDTRLGTVHVMILSSVHADHIGDTKATAVNAGTCGAPGTTPAQPNSNFAEIAAAKNATVIAGGEMTDYLTAKITGAGGTVNTCPGTVDLTVSDPPGATNLRTCVLRHGGKRIVHLTSLTNPGVLITVVRADHSNGVPRNLLTDPEKTELAADGLTAYAGPENGFVLIFTNGLSVYLSADSGQTSDMATIVNGYYGAKLAVVNMGDVFSMGPEEAAFAVKTLIKPKAAIPSHANEAATDASGNVLAGTRTERFLSLIKGIPGFAPLSGVTMEFDGNGTCVAGPGC